ncbi:Lpg1974 family pore-forming outer membrane protein [Hoeflea sp. TYP-13]|uniref:Lpg1974 family pore-forming outer membrane protein n=1 Tax=Hoeflea sp. TYP-13 TaxID=3230023 RepID=UPI0034C5B764
MFLAQMPADANAGDGQTKLILELNGGAIWGDSQPWAVVAPSYTPYGDLQKIRPDYYLGGLIGVIAPMNKITPEFGSEWDVGFFARLGISDEQSEGGLASYFYNILGGNYPTYYTAGSATHRETHAIVDFEARRDVGLGSQNGGKTTLKAGLRFGYFNAETDTQFVYLPSPSFTLTDTRRSRFIGAGPRIGLESVIPVAPNVTFDLAGAGALLFGIKDTSVTTAGALGGISGSSSSNVFDVVPMLEASAALSFRSDSMPGILSVGVRTEAWFGAYNQTTAITGDDDANRYIISPFARLTMPIGSAEDVVPSTSNFVRGRAPASDSGPVFEMEGWGGYLWRNGNAINQSGSPFTEIDDYPMAGGGTLLALPVGSNWLVQLEADGESTFNNAGFGFGLAPADDTYSGGYTGGGHLSYTHGNFLIGGFAGAGQVFFNDASILSQDADFWLAGGEARYLTEYGSLALQVGYLDISADNSETLSNAAFVRVAGQKFFNRGQTMLQAGFGYASGDQDADDPPINSTDVLSWDVTLEHQLVALSGDNTAASVFVSYQGLQVNEDSTSGGTDRVTDQGIYAGLKFRLGASETLYEREMSTAPGLPNAHRWLGAVPAVD